MTERSDRTTKENGSLLDRTEFSVKEQVSKMLSGLRLEAERLSRDPTAMGIIEIYAEMKHPTNLTKIRDELTKKVREVRVQAVFNQVKRMSNIGLFAYNKLSKAKDRWMPRSYDNFASISLARQTLTNTIMACCVYSMVTNRSSTYGEEEQRELIGVLLDPEKNLYQFLTKAQVNEIIEKLVEIEVKKSITRQKND